MRFFLLFLIATGLASWPVRAQQPAAGLPSGAGSSPAPGPQWIVGSAPARITVEVDGGNRPSPLTWTDLKLPNGRWAAQTIRVFDENGVGVGSEMLTTAPGEPTILLFDSSSGSKHYSIYLGAGDWPPLPLKDDKQGVWLEMRQGDGKEYDKLPNLLAAMDKSPAVLGRAVVPGIFEGGNRFGPQGDAFLHFRGYFTSTGTQHFDFAIMSTDSSFLRVDGKDVVAWTGAHDWWGGMHGEHTGGIDLPAGLHELDYYNDYFQPKGPPLLCCLAVKGGTFAQWTMLTPNDTFFSPTDHAHVTDYAARGDGAPPLLVNWTVKQQTVIEHDNADVGFINLTLSCRPPPVGAVKWTFDDGTTAQGAQIDHLFPRPGLRTVQVEADGPPPLPPVRQVLHVHPDWTKLTTTPPALDPAAKADILARDPNTFTPSDLAGCAAVFGTFQAADAIIKLQPTLVERLKDIADGDLPYIRKAAAVVAPDLSQANVSAPLLQALLDRSAGTPSLAPIANWVRLNLAQVTLLTTDRLNDVKTLLSAIDPKSFDADDYRRWMVLQGDEALATGDVDGARQRYQDQTGNPQGPDARSGVRTTGRIGQARAFLDRKDFAAAEDALKEVAWGEPIEKLSPDWALTRLRLYQEENLPGVALLYARRLLPVVTGGERSDLLYRLTELAAQQGDHDLAGRTLAELLEKHPYSEEAAKAKAKWPGGV